MTKPLSPEEEAQLTANVAKPQARLDAEISETRVQLERWLNCIPESRNVSTMNALLEAAFDRYIELLSEPDAFQRIESAFQRVAKKTRPTLQ
jgi:hypothetical protein